MNPASERLIDGTDYRTIEGYLRHPDSPIEFILHVRDRAALSKLAGKLDEQMRHAAPSTESIRSLILPLMEQGQVLLTSRRPVLLPVEQLVSMGQVPPDTFCHVIHLPPFYLSHTEGLFERREINNSRQARPAVTPPVPTHRMKL